MTDDSPGLPSEWAKVKLEPKRSTTIEGRIRSLDVQGDFIDVSTDSHREYQYTGRSDLTLTIAVFRPDAYSQEGIADILRAHRPVRITIEVIDD